MTSWRRWIAGLAPGDLREAYRVTDRGRHVALPRVGDLDLDTASALDAAVQRAAQSAPAVALDLTELSFMDSSGIKLLVRLAKRAQTDGLAFSIIPPPPRVARVLELTAVTEFLPLASGPPEAMPAHAAPEAGIGGQHRRPQ